MRFMLSRRWFLFAVTVVVLAYGCYLLGRWQFHRLQETKATNLTVARNLKAAPVPVSRLLAVGRPASPDDEWRRVTATGRYVPRESLTVRYQTRSGLSGVDIVTPLRTTRGPALLVDRGWTTAGNTGQAPVHPPAPPSGRVTVVGWVRVNATGSAAAVADRSTRAVSSATIAPTLPFRVYGGFLDAQTETPRAAHPLVKAELPSLGNGPHFFYGLQWWFFGVLAVFGFCYLAYDERKKLRAPTSGTPTEQREPAASR